MTYVVLYNFLFTKLSAINQYFYNQFKAVVH